MVERIPCLIYGEELEELYKRVLKMNTGIDSFVVDEMLHHKEHYDSVSGFRKTNLQLNGNQYNQLVLEQADGYKLPVEIIASEVKSRRVILYIHGAAFHRRSNDINIKTADRMCSRTGQMVVVPDYRVGESYTYNQMVSDVVATYKWIVEQLGYSESDVTILADSSGCITAMQAMFHALDENFYLPGKMVLWSPQYDDQFDYDRIQKGKEVDVALRPNDLFGKGFRLYRDVMCRGLTPRKTIPCYGDFRGWENTQILIQSGSEEMLTPDAIALDELLGGVCQVTTELYMGMFHNFATYYSMCEMARVCWDRAVKFILSEDISQHIDGMGPLLLA